MSKHDLLLEIGLEEMPARFVTDAMNQLEQKISNWLSTQKISYDRTESFSTPRRLAVVVKGLAEKQEDIEEEYRGPAKKIALDENGNWTKAVQGFARSKDVSLDDIYFQDIKDTEYVFVKKFIKGKETLTLFNELENIVLGLNFPKNMRWGTSSIRFVRPIKWIVAIYGTKVIPLEIAGVKSNNRTFGHRFLGKETYIQTADTYAHSLLSEFVIANPKERKEAIINQLNSLADDNNWYIQIDEQLLEEVTNIVEYPTALFGKFDQEFLELPKEVLVTSMKEHQRYFPVTNENGELLPIFITVRNGDHMHIENVKRGNEKVLRARLADARFFYVEDQKHTINEALEKLNRTVFHEELGTMGDKVKRIGEYSESLCTLLNITGEQKVYVLRTAEICKFDLVTHMVYEFPELQGVMGTKYARIFGENEMVSTAINEHYMPRHANDATPSSDIGAIISISDKLDTIVSFFAIGQIPSGSQDPYGLRRQALGIVQTLKNKGWSIDLQDLIKLAVEKLDNTGLLKSDKEKVQDDLVEFFRSRVKYVLQEQHIRHDIIDAVLAERLSVVSHIISKANVLMDQKDTSNFKEIIEALSRVVNIAEKAKDSEINPDLFSEEQEKKLYNVYLDAKQKLDTQIQDRQFADVYTTLANLKVAINNYFDHVMVMVDDIQVKNNRLAQMKELANLISKFAKVNHIIVK